MEIDIQYRPVNSLATVRLEAGEEFVAEPGAMVGMSTNVEMETGMSGSQHDGGGGLLSTITSAASRMLTGESFFQNTFRAERGTGELHLAHTLTGDMVATEVPDRGLMIQSASYIASHPAVELNTKLGGFKTMFAGEGIFLMRASSHEPGAEVVLGAFGGIEKMQVDGSLVIDTGHLVAWEAQLDYSTERATSGFIGSMLSGEGLVCHFQGEGDVWLQTRHPGEFGRKIGRRLPPKED